MMRRLSDEDQDDGNDQQHDRDRGRDHGAGKAEAANRDDEQRHAGNAAETRAVQRQADRHTASLVEPEAERIGDDGKAGAGPGEREQRVGGVELPGRTRLSDRDRRRGKRKQASQQTVARTEPPDRFGHEDHDQGAEQIEERRRARDQRGRPAARAMQLGEIDGLPIEAEAPAEGRDQKADGDDPPAVIAERGFVDGKVTRAVQFVVSCFLHRCSFPSVMPGLVPGIHVFFFPEATKDVDGRDKPGHDDNK